MVCTDEGYTRILTSLPPRIYWICGKVQPDIVEPFATHVGRKSSVLAKVVENAVKIYNDTPLSSPEESKETPKSFVFGSPNQLWKGSRVIWARLREYA